QIAHRLAERAADRIARLQAVTAALSRAQTPVQVAEAVIVEAIAALEAQAGAVLELSGDGTQFHILTQTGYATDTSEAAAVLQEWPRVSLREATPAGDAVRSGDVVILESAVDRAARYPYLRSVTEVMGGGASVAIPLLLNGKPIGVMHLLFATARRFDADDRALLLTIGRQCAQALERARLYQQAQDALRVRDEFLSIAAHELKTPVAALRLLAQASLRRLERFSSLEPDRLTRIFRDIDQQSHRLARLVNQLLDISRLELGRVQIQCYPTELKGLIEGIIDSLRSREGGERIVMTRGETLIVNLDPLRIEQVITNLLDNALKYSRASGLIEVNVAREGQEAIVSVTDHGPGIPPERRDRIFERFYQAHQDSNLSGLGLGLYISRQLVELHRGSLEAEFPPEGGTRFIVRLPIVPIQAAT
ncbi:MAG TPA: ATP-binding protein, partial [Chloroflexota bacterium]|nr:ATP-binding protein [Chloroflexota bacterium]